jgi:hypothetical protein
MTSDEYNQTKIDLNSTDLNFRNAYLVLAHEDVEMLNLLVKRLINTGYVYIHIDLKSRIKVEQVHKHPKVRVTKQIKVNWGGFSFVEATRLLADQALEDGANRLTLLSGLSYPIVGDEKLTDFARSAIEYVDAVEVLLNNESKALSRRFTSRHFSFHFKQNIFGRIIRRISREFWARMPQLQPGAELNQLTLMRGSQWWSVKTETYSSAMDTIMKSPTIENYFRKIECSDESFFSTIFTPRLESKKNSGTTYVKWARSGGPRPILLTDLAREKESKHYLFVRKICSQDGEFLNFLSDGSD